MSGEGKGARTVEVDDELLDALRVVWVEARTNQRGPRSPTWKAMQLVRERFGLDVGGGVPFPIDRFKEER